VSARARAARYAYRGIEVHLAGVNVRSGALPAAVAGLGRGRRAVCTRGEPDERTRLRRQPRAHEQLHLPWGVEQQQRRRLQADLHVANTGGTFLGLWGSSRDSQLDPYADYEFVIYLGHRFDLGNAWSATLSGRAHYLVGGTQEVSDDYQEIAAAITWLDAWTLSFTAIPNAPRYWFYDRLSRAPAFVAEMSGQWLVYDGFFFTGGAGYYHITGTGPGIEAPNGYAYGNVGIAWEHRRWRIDLGYYRTGEKAQVLMPYPSANDRFAGSIAWRF